MKKEKTDMAKTKRTLAPARPPMKDLDRKPEREYELAEIREELPEAVAQAQFKEKYDAWLKTLRAKAQIEYRALQ